jgi:DNA-binding response OmpR family regulator
MSDGLHEETLEEWRTDAHQDSRQRILVLDDDQYFRALITQILEGHGYKVIEARGAHEATDVVETQKPHLGLVDFRLPGIDGMTWIQQIREQGYDFPIIFVSGTWCDAKMFSRLRNLLKVSLIMQKPITQEVLLHSIEMLLPERSQAEFFEEDGQHSEGLMEGSSAELEKLRKKEKTRKLVEAAKVAYVEKIPAIWDELAVAAQAARATPIANLIVQVAHLAHKLKGSTGSYGFVDLSYCAQRIENLLKAIDLEARETEQEVVWSEIIRCVGEGTQIVRQLAQSKAPSRILDAGAQMTLLACAPTLEWTKLEEACRETGFALERAPELHELVSMQRRKKYDAVLIDLNIGKAKVIYQIIGSLRSSSASLAQLPFCLVASKTESTTLADLIYTGCSAFIEQPDEGQCIRDALDYLKQDCTYAKPRILCVDDDPMLTKFAEAILTDAGYTVKSINEPITILDALNEFPPDLILLDVIMPGLTGYEVCRMLRLQEQWSNLPIIFVTAKSNAAGRAAAYEAGGNDFLAKPVLPAELLARVKSQLAVSLSEKMSGLMHREQFEKQFKVAAPHSQKMGLPSSLAVVSIEHYREHQERGAFTTDYLFSTLAQLLTVRFRRSDLRCRWQDNLFVVFLPGVDASATEASLKYLSTDWDLIQAVSTMKIKHGQLSVGYVQLGPTVGSLQELIEEAVSNLHNGNHPDAPLLTDSLSEIQTAAKSGLGQSPNLAALVQATKSGAEDQSTL